MEKGNDKGQALVAERLAHTMIHSWLDELADAGVSGRRCYTTRQLEDYVTGRTALLVGNKLLAHSAGCAGCRHRMTALGLMESRCDGRLVRRLPYIREMVRGGSVLAGEAALRAGEWLAELSLKAAGPADLHVFGIPVRKADGRAEEIPAKLIAPLQVDSQGRLLLQMSIGVPPGSAADARVSLKDSDSELLLFSCHMTDGRLDALVDLACLGCEPLSIPGDVLLLDLSGLGAAMPAAPGLTVDLELLGAGAPINLAAVDGILKLAELGTLTPGRISAELSGSLDRERSARALSGAVELLGRYTQMWVVGNQGEIPQAAADLLTVIACELETRTKASAVVSTSLDDKSSLRISRPFGRKHLKADE